MPIFLILAGTALIAATLRGQEGTLFEVLKDDFTGNNNFAAWLLAIIFLGVIGNTWKEAEPLMTAFLVLVVVALLMSNQGFIEKLKQQVL
jgi:hypothetical protein